MSMNDVTLSRLYARVAVSHREGQRSSRAHARQRSASTRRIALGDKMSAVKAAFVVGVMNAGLQVGKAAVRAAGELEAATEGQRPPEGSLLSDAAAVADKADEIAGALDKLGIEGPDGVARRHVQRSEALHAQVARHGAEQTRAIRLAQAHDARVAAMLRELLIT